MRPRQRDGRCAWHSCRRKSGGRAPIYMRRPNGDSADRHSPDAPEHSVVHMVFVLALFRFCSPDERNIRQHQDTSRHGRNGLRPARTSVLAGSGFGSILAYNAGVGGSNPSPPTSRTPWSEAGFRVECTFETAFYLPHVPHCSASEVKTVLALFRKERSGHPVPG
jgi:hypothetical protein